MTEALNFPAICRDVTKNFIRTAVLIDDDAFVDRDLTPPTDDIVEPEFLGVPLSPPAEPVPPREENSAMDRPSDVNLKPLADAFLDQRIVCAVLKPADEEDEVIINRAVTACANADVVILDWFLRKGNAELSQQSLARLLAEDGRQNGRMRVVVIYTSAAPLQERQQDLDTYLRSAGFTVEQIENAERPTVKVGSTRIVFVEKSYGRAGIQVGELPEIAITEFANEAHGIMPAFAMSAVAAVRDGTHHLLSLFRSELDPALLGHRMVLEEPLDTNEFLLSVLLLQIKGLLTREQRLEDVLATQTVEAWFEHHANGKLGDFLSDSNIDPAKAKASLATGKAKTQIGKENVQLLHKGLFRTEGDGEHLEEQRASELARLSSHVREADGFTPARSGWVPHLTIGSVVRMEPSGDAASLYLLCTQPLCDTVRLQKDTPFAFTALTSSAGGSKDFWLVVKSGERHFRLRAEDLTKASARHFASFRPDPATKRISAALDEASGDFLFKDANGQTYTWIADLDQLKAQRAASEMASVLGRVGLDEYEWLRRGGNVKG